MAVTVRVITPLPAYRHTALASIFRERVDTGLTNYVQCRGVTNRPSVPWQFTPSQSSFHLLAKGKCHDESEIVRDANADGEGASEG